MAWIKEHKRLIMKLLLCLVVAAALFGGCSALNRKLGLSDDNLIEEALEHQIEEHTGIDLDLSPESQES